MNYAAEIALELGLALKQVEKTVELIEGGATIPFIARYRKEATGSLDEVQIAAIRNKLVQLKELDKRRQTVLQSIEEQGKLTEELKQQIMSIKVLSELEDLYLPYKPKRKTRASIAIAKGLEPFAKKIFEQRNFNLYQEATLYVDIEKQVESEENALLGARDIIAEWINEDVSARGKMRNLLNRTAILSSEIGRNVDEDEAQKYKSWFHWSEKMTKAPSHRILAMFRGENDGFLKVNIEPENEEDAITLLNRTFLKDNNDASKQVQMAIKDSYKRLLLPSMETEFRNFLKEKADIDAIHIFSENLRQLLLSPPLGQKNVLAIDPGFRTGCKLVCLDKQGQLLHNETIYPFSSVRDEREAISKVENLVESFKIEAIAIGNGTAGRETEEMVKKAHFKQDVIAIMVNESGASVYSASDVARQEFPDYDITVRGAVSIGRRLMDPLAELVKIDPKSIGVGQYQHDVNQTKLGESLDDTVISCVNNVGVELNTASKELLSHVSGIGPVLAKKIIEYRNKIGAFKSRFDLLNVPRFGEKSFEQSAGFLRINLSENPLDKSAVHPERYELVERMAKKVGCQITDLIQQKELRSEINIKEFISADCGLPTLEDIMKELDKPGRDPRTKFEFFEFSKEVSSINDLREGMILPGIITNITAFGAFVDVGVHQDGLVHVSQLANKFVSDPNEVVKLHQKVMVKVVSVDMERKRIAFSMKEVK